MFPSTIIGKLNQWLIYVWLYWSVIIVGYWLHFSINAIKDTTDYCWSFRKLTMVNADYPILIKLVLRCLYRVKDCIFDRAGSTFMITITLFRFLGTILRRILSFIHSERIWAGWLKILIASSSVFPIIIWSLIGNWRTIWVILVLLNNERGTWISHYSICRLACPFHNWLCFASVSSNYIFLKFWWSGGEGFFVISSAHVPLHY